ncbi:DNA cross-link repair 1A protein [Morus notabilis]|uniref:DNA cross-link repair 1A protein n=1 Tax=Morus notabilis TaxID=981085 RepID=W9R709_9ROSA|nr:DNA cross-link repair 1A protein [Morus notabilis]
MVKKKKKKKKKTVAPNLDCVLFSLPFSLRQTEFKEAHPHPHPHLHLFNGSLNQTLDRQTSSSTLPTSPNLNNQSALRRDQQYFAVVMSSSYFDDDDDFQIPLSRSTATPQNSILSQRSLKSSSFSHRPSKIPKCSTTFGSGKENVPSFCLGNQENEGFKSLEVVDCSLESIPSSFDCTNATAPEEAVDNVGKDDCCSSPPEKKELLNKNWGYSRNSIESRLMKSWGDRGFGSGDGGSAVEDDEDEGELDELLKLCSALEEEDSLGDNGGSVECPLCGVDISDVSEEQRHRHTNDCLDKGDSPAQDVIVPREEGEYRVSRPCGEVSGVVEWLRGLGLTKYEDIFVREEIVWDTLQWLTEEDLFNIGITALGPRKKIVHALSQLRKGSIQAIEVPPPSNASSEHRRGTNGVEMPSDVSERVTENASKVAANKLITDYFPGYFSDRKKVCDTGRQQRAIVQGSSSSGRKRVTGKKHITKGKLKDPPSWCSIPGTPFRVDAFRYLRGDCSHWFLTHFHMDHYQGLTRSFCHGLIYCSSITAKLVNMKIGIPWDRLHVLPLNQKINIGGIDVTCLDANHCPGAIIILFEPPNGQAVLHTGDFRFSEDKDMMPFLRARFIHTLVLDTTYCNPQASLNVNYGYDFPKQEAVIQFVLDAIQAETFNPKTLFLIGSYTIGKERLFLEVARVLRKKVYVNAAKLRILNCLGFPQEDMQWFTVNEQESQIHVVPMWTLASFKRLKHVANQYKDRFSLIVAFSPTGWTFSKGKKKSPGKKWQQGTIIRYEVPYSEHSSFTELKEFVKIISPVNIIPSVNNDGPDSANAMVSLLLSQL